MEEQEYYSTDSFDDAAAGGQPADEPDHKRTVTILAVALAVVVICLCATLAFTAGFSLFGRGSEPTATPIPTAVPTPEPGQPPTAVISAPAEGVTDQQVTFDGSYSQAARGSSITSYIWDFGDGTQARGINVAYAYSQAGNYNVKLTVTDQNGLSDSATLRIRISDPTPTPTAAPSATPSPTATAAAPVQAVIQGPADVNVGQVASFDGRGSTSGYPIVNYAWDFGDRTQGNGAVVDHVYAQPGLYTVTLTVIDNAGQSGMATAQIAVNAVEQTPPSAAIEGPSQATIDEDVTFTSRSQPGSSAIVSYAWDLGSPSASARNTGDVSVTTRYSEAGTYTVSLIVTDENGLNATASTQIQVNANLEGGTWYLTQVQPGTTITLELNGGQVSGSGGCNDYQGGYTVDTSGASGPLAFSALTATQRQCPAEVMAQEDTYLASLAAVSSYSISGSSLTLTYPGGNLTFSNQQPQAAQPR